MQLLMSSERLAFRTLQPEHAEAMFTYRSLAEISRYQNWEPGTVSELRAFLKSLAGTRENPPGQWHQLGIFLGKTGELIGDCGIQAKADPRQAEVGITLAPAFQRQGFALETLRAVLDHLFVMRKVHRVFASVDPRNLASMALFRRAGFREEAHFVASIWTKDEWQDDVVFGLLAREWAPDRVLEPGAEEPDPRVTA